MNLCHTNLSVAARSKDKLRVNYNRKATSERNFGMTNKFDCIHTNTNKKYIIRNCPSCRYTPKRYIDGIDYICWNAQNFNSSVKGLCQDCTDCVMKQIVEKCRNTQFLSTKNRLDLYAVKVFANDLLQLLDIQEVE